nr:GNAT family N-acetyltransferase [Candidatus Sigynarchaeota archaeon]
LVLYSDNIEASNLVQSLGFSKHFFAVLWELNLLAPLRPIPINPHVSVRLLQRTDLAAITTIIQESRPDLHEKFSTLEKITEFYTHADPWAEMSLVAEFNGEVVGFMEFTQEGLVGIAGVLPRVRKQGIGSTLFYHLLATMKKRGKEKALVDSGMNYLDAIRMYERFGFDTSRKLWVWTKLCPVKSK